MKRTIKQIHSYSSIGVIPGVHGQRPFPTRGFREADPFVMLDHIGPQQVGTDYFLDGKGHDHPHRGFETLTFMFEGRMDHRDSRGNELFLESGSVQRMNAGSGIVHGGDMAADPKTGRFHEVQLWINNPASEKMSEPEVQNAHAHQIPVVSFGEASLRVVGGTLNNTIGPFNTKAQTQIAHLVANGSSTVSVEGIMQGYLLMVYVLEGGVEINGQKLEAYQLAELEGDEANLEIQVPDSASALVLAGKPLNEPVVFGGPFVMNTQEEIEQAYADFQQGLFGQIAYAS